MPDHSALRDGDAEFRDGVSHVRGGDPREAPRVTRLAAYGVLVRDGAILLSHVSPGNIGAGLWTLPGGGLDFGEMPEAGAVREVEEETGLVAEVTGPPVIHSDTGTWDRRAGPVLFHAVRFVYPMRVVGGEERLEIGGSTDAFEWVRLDEIPARRLGDLVERALVGIGVVGRGETDHP
jgi:8-oxo-dGTP diphosphatase